MGKNKSKRLIKINTFLTETNAEIIGGLGLGGGIRTLYRPLSILYEVNRALKSDDIWVKDNILKNHLIAKSRLTQENVKIPLKSLLLSLRRHSGIKYYDISKKADFLIVNKFKEIDTFLLNDKTKKTFKNNINQWKNYVNKRLGNILIVRKLDLSAPGTTFLSFFSSVPLAPGEFWVLQKVPLEHAKIITLWLNSTPNLAQILLNRTETRGTWMKNDLKSLKECYILDPRALTKKEYIESANIFNEFIDVPYPSIIEQLKTKYQAKYKIDEWILRILGFEEEEINSQLNLLYESLYSEIMSLKRLMKG